MDTKNCALEQLKGPKRFTHYMAIYPLQKEIPYTEYQLKIHNIKK